MQLAIVLVLVVAVSAALLLYQYFAGVLAPAGAPNAAPSSEQDAVEHGATARSAA